MTQTLGNNYQHQHINYSHVVYSKERDTPQQFYHTHTNLDLEQNILYHHHHVYNVVYITQESTIVSNECPTKCPTPVPTKSRRQSGFRSDESYKYSIEDLGAARSLLCLRNSLDREVFLNYYNDDALRKRVKEAHNHFSLLDINDYLVRSWTKMTREERSPWSEKALQKMFTTRKDQTSKIDDIDDIEINGSVNKIEINISRDKTYTKEDLIEKEVCIDEKIGKVIGTYRRKGKALRYRVDWGDKRELYYKKDIIKMLRI